MHIYVYMRYLRDYTSTNVSLLTLIWAHYLTLRHRCAIPNYYMLVAGEKKMFIIDFCIGYMDNRMRLY